MHGLVVPLQSRPRWPQVEAYDLLPLADCARLHPQPEHDAYPRDWYCPICGRAFKREYYSAADPSKDITESFRRVCPRGHWWGYTERPPSCRI